MIQAFCTCGERYELRDEVAGRRIRCFTCSELFEVPGRPVDRSVKNDARARQSRNPSLFVRLLGGGLITRGLQVARPA